MTTSTNFAPVPDCCADAESAFATTLGHVLKQGHTVGGGSQSLSIGAGKISQELLNYICVIKNPRQRLIYNSRHKFNLPAAVARFVWMMAGSDRLADIAFYEPKVNQFTDDGISVPGSSYGQRILRARPGLNQLASVIDRLKTDPSSRRAAISIYQPEDATRNSRDIPCAFGLFYHVRQNELFATTLMRSNNAFILMPYNVFEFSLLAEVVATEVGVEFGQLSHQAMSMHIYENAIEASRAVVAAHEAEYTNSPPPTIPSMSPGTNPLEQVRQLVILEAELRHSSAGLAFENVEDWIERGQQRLDSYWRQMYFLLLLHVVARNKDSEALRALRAVIELPWLAYLQSDAFTTDSRPAQSAAQLIELELATGAYASPKVIPLFATRLHKSLKRNAALFEAGGKGAISWQQFAALEAHFGARIAASGSDFDLTLEEFEVALAAQSLQMN